MKRLLFAAIVGAALIATARPDAAAPAAGDERTMLHVLNRVTFGATSADLAHVKQVGLQRYIEEQLHPERMADDAVEKRLAGFETLRLNLQDIAERFEIPAMQAQQQRRAQAASDNGAVPATPPAAPNPQQERANLPMVELSAQKVLRAVYSERQLEEVLTDFWFNHFNVDARKGPVRYMLTEYERDVIRPHVLGHFRDLLGATAKSPAMLFYLDNWMSADPNGPHPEQMARAVRPAPRGAGQPRPGPFGNPRLGQMRPDRPAAAPNAPAQPQARQRAGLNENYGRELLELHTLGVDGGYTQKDVTEVARAFTGWTIQQPRMGGSFRFVAALHDPGEKTVLGHRIKAGGERDAEEVLDILASHPSTARFISTKLARRFVSDTPPEALVGRMAATFRRSNGDLRAVMTVLLTSPEFLAPAAQRAKVKNPFEFVVSTLRATGADIQDARPVVRMVQQLGMPLYQCQPPTGYKDSADTWINTGALVSRMNVALMLAGGRAPGIVLPGALDPLSLVPPDVSDTTKATIAKAQAPPQALALALGSPEFQRR